MNYTESEVPDLTGKVFFVTGANIGVGFETARILAQKNARVLLGCRSEDKAAEALNQIRTLKPEADVVWVPLDLSSLRSIASSAERVQAESRLDGLINNAGVMMPPRTETEDGCELQFGVILSPKPQRTWPCGFVNFYNSSLKCSYITFAQIYFKISSKWSSSQISVCFSISKI